MAALVATGTAVETTGATTTAEVTAFGKLIWKGYEYSNNEGFESR